MIVHVRMYLSVALSVDLHMWITDSTPSIGLILLLHPRVRYTVVFLHAGGLIGCYKCSHYIVANLWESSCYSACSQIGTTFSL